MQSRYQILEEINQGGVGVVLKALDTRLNRHVAIKRFLPSARESGIESDLLREASTLSALQHPNVVSVFDVDNDPRHGVSVVMEYLNGQDLEQAVAEAALTLDDFYTIAQQTLDALSSAHGLGLLHRDIKPSNIQVTWLANGKFVSKFVDFGLARFFDAPKRQTVRADGTVMGSVFFMSPEQIERLPLDHRSDIYSLGCVFYFALSMHRPFEGKSVQDVLHAHLNGTCMPLGEYRPNLPAPLLEWIAWLMARKPDDRPTHAENALIELRAIIAQASAPATDAPASAPSARVSTVVATPVETTEPAPTAASPPRRQVAAQSSSLSLWLGGAAMTALSATAVFVIMSRQASRNSGPSDGAVVPIITSVPNAGAGWGNPAVSETPPQPDALVLWFDASRGALASPLGAPAGIGQGVCQWSDLSPVAGAGHLQYFETSTAEPERYWPHREDTLIGMAARPVLRFEEDHLLLCNTQRVGNPIGYALDQSGITCLIVCRPDNSLSAPDALFNARGPDNTLLWSIGWQDGLVTGPQPGSESSRRPLNYVKHPGGFLLICVVFDRASGTCQRRLINMAGDKVVDECGIAPTTMGIDTIRLGSTRAVSSDIVAITGEHFFRGDVAEILVYASSMTDNERRKAEDYLRLKHFGSAQATTLAASR